MCVCVCVCVGGGGGDEGWNSEFCPLHRPGFFWSRVGGGGGVGILNFTIFWFGEKGGSFGGYWPSAGIFLSHYKN